MKRKARTVPNIEDAMAAALDDVRAIKDNIDDVSEKLKMAIAAFMAMGWSEEDARKMIGDTLRDEPAQGSA